MNREEPSCRISFLGARWARRGGGIEDQILDSDVIRSFELVLMLLWQRSVM
jgi:hypothetical protein